jgi:hypothetical protein
VVRLKLKLHATKVGGLSRRSLRYINAASELP